MVNHKTLNFIDVIYSDLDILLYPVDRLVFTIDCQAETFTYVHKDDIRNYKQAGFSSDKPFHDTFMDVCILAGGVFDIPVAPMLSDSYNSMGALFTFERAIDMLRTFSSGVIVIREHAPDSVDYMNQFCRAKAILTYMPIMNLKGYVQTLSQNRVPNNIATLITPRLSNEIYFYISKRLVGTELYDLLMSDHLKVQAPLEGGDLQEYRTLLNDMIPIRTTCLSLLSSHSNRFLCNKHLV